MRLAPPPVMKGGILADSMGLGKTLEVLGLIVASLEDLKREATEAAKHCKEDDLIPTHATLIIVPPALVSQWKSEIRKATGDALVVQCFNPKTLTFESDKNQEEDEDPDIVITTYSALSANNSSRTLSSFAWGRICLDEMQELRVSTTKISKNCDKLSCRRRWMISGTPLFEGFEDLRGELNFLQLEPYAARLEDGFFDFSITNHLEQHSLHGLETLRILGMLMLRRSKTMTIAESGHPLLGLKPLTVEFLPVPQDPSERAVYCFLESIVSRVLNGDAKNASSRAKCLAILREMCISGVSAKCCVLLSGSHVHAHAHIPFDVPPSPDSSLWRHGVKLATRYTQYVVGGGESDPNGHASVKGGYLNFLIYGRALVSILVSHLNVLVRRGDSASLVGTGRCKCW